MKNQISKSRSNEVFVINVQQILITNNLMSDEFIVRNFQMKIPRRQIILSKGKHRYNILLELLR